MTDLKLSEGSLKAIMNREEVSNPVMQILGTKSIPGGSTQRYRVLISDGVNINSFAMLATQLNDLITNGNLCEFTIVQIKRYIVSEVTTNSAANRAVLIILELNVLKQGTEVGFKIGNPQSLTADSSSAQQSNAGTTNVGSRALSNGTSATLPKSNGVSSSGGNIQTHPIASLSPYQNRWTIKARVTNKTPIREWSNARSTGKLFSVDLLDESGEIRATMFNAECDKFIGMLEKDKVYYISNCTLKPANKKFSSINNDYEMTFTNSTSVIPVSEEDIGSLPSIKYNFVPLKSLSDASAGDVIDVLGICIEAADISTVTGKTNQKTYIKRDITLVDQSLASVTLTLWGEEAEAFESSNKPIIAVKNARVQEFQGGKTLSFSQSSILSKNPDIPESHKLQGWYASQSNTKFEAVSQRTGGSGSSGNDWILLKEIQDRQLGKGDKADYFTVRAVVQAFRGSNTTYKACPTPDCNKKVIDQNNGMFRCEKCNKEFNTFKYRLILPVSIGDWTNSVWVTLFQTEAEAILGATAQEMGESSDDHPALKRALFKQYIFRLRAKLEFYNDENRLKITCAGVKPVDHVDLSKRLINEIKALSGVRFKTDTN